MTKRRKNTQAPKQKFQIKGKAAAAPIKTSSESSNKPLATSEPAYGSTASTTLLTTTSRINTLLQPPEIIKKNPSDSKLLANTWLKSKNLSEQFQLGVATEQEDSFFDSIAQAYNQIRNDTQTVQSLRKLCYDYAYDSKNLWVKEAINNDLNTKNSTYEIYLVRILLTDQQVANMVAENVFRKDETAIRGRPLIEGRMLCAQLNIELHYIKLHATKQAEEYLINANGLITQTDFNALYLKADVLHIMIVDDYCHVPLINTSKTKSLPASISQHHSPSLANEINFLPVNEKVPDIEGLSYQRVLADGHCLFHAVSLYIGAEVFQLRKLVADNLKAHIDDPDFINVILSYLPEDKDLQDYIQDIIDGKEWADQTEIITLMKVLNQAIVIIGPEGEIRNRTDIEPYIRSRILSDEPIFVYYNGNNHYDAFVKNFKKNSWKILKKLLKAHLSDSRPVIQKNVDNNTNQSDDLLAKERLAESTAKPYFPWSQDTLLKQDYTQREATLQPKYVKEVHTSLAKLSQALPEDQKPLFDHFFEKLVHPLEKLEIIELSYYRQNLWEQTKKEFVYQIKQSKFYKKALNVINNLEINSNFYVEVQFDINAAGEIVLSNKIKIGIRKSGTQYRHITPIGLTERIMLHDLKVGETVNSIINKLLNRVEIFRPYFGNLEESNLLVQQVIEVFKNPEEHTPSGLVRLLKIIIHLYHEMPYLVMTDNCIKIPYKTNDIFVVPTLDPYKKRLHGGEGSFINVTLSILDSFEKKLQIPTSQVLLSILEFKQMTYAIFAMFDFLPLPLNAKPLKKKIDYNKDRYKTEPLERLVFAVFNYLSFIHKKYQMLSYFYKDEIDNEFLRYLTEGVKEQDLFDIYDVKNEDQLITCLQQNLKKDKASSINGKFIQEKLLRHKGFAQQYKGKILKKDQKNEELPNLFFQELKNRLNLCDPHIIFSDTSSVGSKVDESLIANKYKEDFILGLEEMMRNIYTNNHDINAISKRIKRFDFYAFYEVFKNCWVTDYNQTFKKHLSYDDIVSLHIQNADIFKRRGSERGNPGTANKFDQAVVDIFKGAIEEGYNQVIVDYIKEAHTNELRECIDELGAVLNYLRSLSHTSSSSTSDEYYYTSHSYLVDSSASDTESRSTKSNTSTQLSSSPEEVESVVSQRKERSNAPS